MISMDVNHPDIEEFINIKTKDGAITKANISIRATDEFMEAVIKDEDFTLRWEGDTGLKVEKTVRARDIFNQNAKNNWDWAEAGFLFWDHIKNNHMMSAHPEHEFSGVNPCKLCKA